MKKCAYDALLHLSQNSFLSIGNILSKKIQTNYWKLFTQRDPARRSDHDLGADLTCLP